MIDELGLRACTRDHGFVDSVAPLLKEMDVLVLSSTTEACPMVVLEAMASGIPVVASNVGGVREILLGEAGRPAGIVVPAATPEAMADALLKLAGSPDTADFMGRNGRILAEERFSLGSCVRSHLAVYRKSIVRMAACVAYRN
jgi:glycosyltransferase involved in cell wall biosynthesis